jgi:MFS family permease
MPVSREHGAAAAMFFVAGWIPAAWATRIPAIKADLGLSSGALGLAILGLEAGAIVGLPAGGALVARLGSRRALKLGFAVFGPGLVAVALAGSLAGLAAALAAMALANSVVDVAMNSQGVELERRSDGPLLARLHAAHPVGLVAGGLAGTAATAANLSVLGHFVLVAGSGVLVALVAGAWLVGERTGRQPAFVRPSRRLLALGLLAFCAFGLDGAAYNWSAVDLRSEHGAGPGVAAAAFTGFALAMAAGRLLGDRLVSRHGRAGVLRASGTVAAVGATVVVLAPGAPLALAGWALFGLGLATVAPTVLGAAPRTGHAAPAVAIATVTTVGYLGSFSGPPLIGAVAEATGLSAALGTLVVAALLLAALARPVLGGEAQRASRTTSRAALSSRRPR